MGSAISFWGFLLYGRGHMEFLTYHGVSKYAQEDKSKCYSDFGSTDTACRAHVGGRIGRRSEIGDVGFSGGDEGFLWPSSIGYVFRVLLVYGLCGISAR